MAKVSKPKPHEVPFIKAADVAYNGGKANTKELKKIATTIFNLPQNIIEEIKEEAHITNLFAPKIEEVYSEEELGTKIAVEIIAVGTLKKNGKVTNIGVKIKAPKGMSRNEIVHITLWISPEGKARETSLCTWTELKTPIGITVKLAIFDRSNNWAFHVQP